MSRRAKRHGACSVCSTAALKQVPGFSREPGQAQHPGLFQLLELFIGSQARGWVGLGVVGGEFQVSQAGFDGTQFTIRCPFGTLFILIEQGIEQDSNVRRRGKGDIH